MAITLDHFHTADQQERALNILQFKLDILWSLLDALGMAYEFDRPPFVGVTDAPVWHHAIDR